MSYNLLAPVHIITAGDMSLASITSPAVEIKLQDNVGIQLDWTGTPTGSFDFQISIDHKEDINGNVQVAGHWISLVLDPAIAASGSTDDAYVDFNQLSASYIRVVYTKDSGTGVLNVLATAKGV